MRTWAEVELALGYMLGGGEQGAATAREVLQQAVAARFGARSLYDLTRTGRQIALQKSIGATLELGDFDGDLAFTIGARDVVARTFAKFFAGQMIVGPEWRMDPTETDRPLYADVVSRADFG